MKRYYYLSKSLEDTDNIHQKLTEQGIEKEHIHVYGLSDEVAQEHDYNPVLSIFKSDVIHYILRGMVIGLVITFLSFMGLSYFVEDVISILPFIILFGALLTGFISWEAGLIGLHKLNYKFVPLIKMLDKTKHLVLIDVVPAQFPGLVVTLREFKNIEAVAVGSNFINPFEEQETLLPREII
jgi:hypothetical protein